jgi:hypothetical protein
MSANWLRYGVQPKNARPGLVPGCCKRKAHDADHPGYAGRRVLVSRKWSGKTLADHRADRQAWLLAALGISATDRPGTAGSSSRPATRTIWIMRGGCCMPLPTAPDGKLRSTKPDAELSSRIWIAGSDWKHAGEPVRRDEGRRGQGATRRER